MHRSKRSLAAKLLPAALLLLQLLAWAAPSHAHGYMNIPASRNFNKWRGELWRATMGNGIGPGADLSRAGRPSACGDPYQDQAPTVTQVVFEKGSSMATYSQGQTISISLTLTVNHGGRHQFAVCPIGINQDCFNNPNNALRLSANNARYYWRPRMGYNPANTANPWSTDSFTTSWRLPAGVSCTNGCVLQWRWITSNTCVMPCDLANGDDPNYCGRYSGSAMCDWVNTWSTPEVFHNCADIIINGAGGGGVVNPTPLPSPSPRPSPSPFVTQPGTGGTCDKCNLSPCRGGCKCDSTCSCRAGLGGSPCDKCNIPQDQGGCKCDSNCNCLAGTCWG